MKIQTKTFEHESSETLDDMTNKFTADGKQVHDIDTITAAKSDHYVLIRTIVYSPIEKVNLDPQPKSSDEN